MKKSVQSRLSDSLADKVTNGMATWTFIIVFLVLCLFEIWSNHTGLFHFDPQTIILNLVLSLIAAIQGSIIMISQNRQSAHDRKVLEHIEKMALRQQKMETKLVLLEETAAADAKRRDERQQRIEQHLQELVHRGQERK